MPQHDDYLIQAIALARANLEDGGRPFGALVVKDSAVLATLRPWARADWTAVWSTPAASLAQCAWPPSI